MLVISRKADEAIIIGDGIEIRVLRVGKDGVRLGITAPADVAIHRREIYEQVRESNKSSVTTAADASRLAERLRVVSGLSRTL
jgi:carbon storage regulator